MRLTKRKAIELSCELWKWLAKTGMEKEDWPEWEENGGKYHTREGSYCFLCEYVSPHDKCTIHGSCTICPYYTAYGFCIDNDSPYALWSSPSTSDEKKHHAGEFLAQLQTLLKEDECQETSID